MNAVQVDRLSRTYVLARRSLLLRRPQRAVEALRAISFTVESGELFGLLGPNGAGKTTTVRILATLLRPTTGSVRVLGLDVVRQARSLRPRIGILFGGDRGLYPRVSGWRNLRYFANLYGIPTRRSSRRIDELLELVGLSERARDRVETYSRGMKQRLHIARVLLHDPEIVFLDEPTIGLDPIGARAVRDLIRDLRSRGRTVLLTTHYMFEADELCDRVAIIDRGRVVAMAAPSTLRSQVPDLYVVEVELFGPHIDALDRLRRLAGDGMLSLVERDGVQVVRLQSARGRDLVPEVQRALQGQRSGPVTVREPTLEDVYVRLVHRARQEAEPEAGVRR